MKHCTDCGRTPEQVSFYKRAATLEEWKRTLDKGEHSEYNK